MRNFKHSILVAALASVLAPATWALGLGDMKMLSYLNEPLKAEVTLLDANGLQAEDIRIRLATADDFSRMGVERAYFLTSLQFKVEIDASGHGSVLLTTTEPLLEPYIDLILETRWPGGRLLREYTVLVDLPDVNGTELVASSASTVRQRTNASVRAETSESRPVAKVSQRTSHSYGQNADASPMPAGRYVVERNDTLWDIAAMSRPSGATVEQTMVATVEMNPQAFNGENINGLKAGYVLNLPSQDDIRLSNRDAQDAVAEQNQDWRNGVRRQPRLRIVADDELLDTDMSDAGIEESAPVDTRLVPDEVGAGLQETPSTEGSTDTAEVDATKDDAQQQPQGGVSGDSAAQSVASSTADLTAIQQRLSQLSDQMDKMSQLVTLKDQQIAALQMQLAAKTATADIASARNGDAEVSESGFSWWIYLVACGLLAILSGIFYTRRADRQAHEVILESIDSRAHGAASADGAVMTTAPTTDSSMGFKQISDDDADANPNRHESQDGERGYGRKLLNGYAQENPVADAIAEADIYIAYGRYQQAIDLLAAATKAEPSHAEGFVKMVEIYLKIDRREEAEALLPAIINTGDIQAQSAVEAMLSQYGPAELTSELVDERANGAANSVVAVDDNPPTAANFNLAVAKDALNEPAATPSEELPVGLASEERTMPSADTPSESAELVNEHLSGIELGLVDLDETELQNTAELDQVTSADLDRKLPPELAAVLGSDIRPPAVDYLPDEEDGGLVYALEASPAEVKLDLARAYLDMGDDEGARPVLEEVISEGDLSQQAQARELLLGIE